MSESLVSQIQRLSPEVYVTLRELDGQFGKLFVREYKKLRWLQMDDTSIQSLVDIGAPARVLSPSIVFMLMGLAFSGGRERLLNLGLGGGAVERGLHAAFPQLVVNTVEIDSRVISLAKEYFYLPDEQTVHEQDAESFVASEAGYYDFVLCDLFRADQLEACITRSGFLTNIERCLSPGGVFVLNLLHSDQAELISALQAVRKHLPATWLVEIKGHQNVIAYFMRERTVKDSELRLACASLLQSLDVEPLSFDWELVTLPNRRV